MIGRRCYFVQCRKCATGNAGNRPIGELESGHPKCSHPPAMFRPHPARSRRTQPAPLGRVQDHCCHPEDGGDRANPHALGTVRARAAPGRWRGALQAFPSRSHPNAAQTSLGLTQDVSHRWTSPSSLTRSAEARTIVRTWRTHTEHVCRDAGRAICERRLSRGLRDSARGYVCQ